MGLLRCPLCGALGAVCGHRTYSVGVTFTDERVVKQMVELKEYDVDGTTLLLSEEDAKARGLKDGRERAVEPDPIPMPEVIVATTSAAPTVVIEDPAVQAGEVPADEQTGEQTDEKAAKTPDTKARTTANK